MYAACFGLFTNLVFFTLIGVGPAVFLLRPQERLRVSLSIAPAIGFALTYIAGAYLTLLDIPVQGWWVGWIVTALAVSGVFLAVRIRRADYTLRDFFAAENIFDSAGLMIAFILIILPLLAGGVNFFTFIGNHHDDSMYITMAEYLSREKFSWVSKVDLSTLLNVHYAYQHCPGMIPNDRWPTGAMLAFCSQLAQVSPCRFSVAFSLLSLLVAYGSIRAFAGQLQLGKWTSLLIALTCCVGFWAQLVTDMRAISQINSLPFVMLFAVLLARFLEKPLEPFRGEGILMGLSGMAIMFAYQEMIAIVLVATVAAIVFRWYAQHGLWRRLWVLLVSVAGAVLCSWPMLGFIFKRFSAIASVATGLVIPWHHTFFYWLYTQPLVGFWGLSLLINSPSLSLLINRTPLLIASYVVAVLGCIILAFLLCHFIFKESLSNPRPAAVAVGAAFSLTPFMFFLVLYAKQQYWAGYKGLFYCYPFFALGIGYMAWAYAGKAAVSSWPKPTLWLARAAVVAWLASQIYIGGYRVHSAATGQVYPGPSYMLLRFTNYRAYDFEMTAIVAAVKKADPKLILVDVKDYWMNLYLDFTLGRDYRLVHTDVLANKNNLTAPCWRETLAKQPDLVIAAKKDSFFQEPTMELGWSCRKLTESVDLVLYQLGLNNPKEAVWWIPIASFGPQEGPYAQWQLPVVAWGHFPAMKVYTFSEAGAPVSLAMSCQSQVSNVVMTVKLNGGEVSVFPFKELGRWQELNVTLKPVSGLNEIEIEYVKGGERAPTGNAVLFKKFWIQPLKTSHSQ